MNPRVEEYLSACEEQKKKKDAEYRAEVLKAAGLITEDRREVSSDEYNTAPFSVQREEKMESDGATHYYLTKQVPIDVTDEEFAAIEKALSMNVKKDVPVQKKDEKSGSAAFFTFLAWLLWIGGLFVSFPLSNMRFSLFMSSFVIYLISGAFCMAAAELFKKLQTIVNLLRQRK